MKMSKVAAMSISLVLVFALLITGCGGAKQPSATGDNSSGSPKSNAKYVLKISHNLATTEVLHEELVKMAKRINEKSNGQLDVQIYPNAELGNSKDGIEQAIRGANIAVVTDTAYIADYVPDYSIMNGPFLYNDYKEILKLAKSPWHQEMVDASAKKGLKILAMNWYFGSRYVISDKVIQKPADLKGMKVRIPQNKMWVETLKAMGANPTQLDLSEVYSGLSQGVVDAAEAPLSTIYGNKWHEVKKNIAATGHFRAFLGLEMSEKFFESLPADLQKLLVEEAQQSGETASELVAKSEEEWKKKLEAEGAKFNDVDVEAFKKATVVVYTKFPEWSPGLYDRIRAELAK